MIDLEYRKLLWSEGYWEIPEGLDTSNFDFDWRPYEYDRPYIHQFGTQHQKTGGPRFVIPENEGIKYQNHQHAIKLPNPDDRGWRPLVPNSTMDFSWHPDDTEPPFIYVFGNQWYDVDTIPTYQYRVKGATEKKYMYDVTARLVPVEGDRRYRPLKPNIEFDYSWQPHPHEPPFIYVFGNQWYDSITMPTLEYRMPGATQKKYVDDMKAVLLPNKSMWSIPDDIEDDFDYSWEPHPIEPPLIWQFGTQWQKNGGPKYNAPNATVVKHSDLFKATKKNIKENRAYRPLVSNIDFDYSWHPDEDEPPYIYVFGNQWYDSLTMPTLLYRVKGATEKKYIDDIKVTLLPNKDNFELTIDRDILFDYSWVPNPNDPALNYVFGNQYHTPEFMPTIMYRTKGATETKYITDIKANLKIDTVYCEDSIFDKIKSYTFETKYTCFNTTEQEINYDLIVGDEKLYVHLVDNIGAIVPREAKINLYDKLTDYPYVKQHILGYDNDLLDIVFFSNGESCADENYEHLLSLNLPNRVIRIDGVKGRVASQHAAANASNTSWYFLVNAKLKVRDDFNFNWQPDIFKSSRHYIFTATNPVNGLEYGHQAIVVNNKKLTLNTIVKGLDFTMDSPTEVVNINSGISMYNSSKYDTWRTAFREMIKLCCNTDQDSIDRSSAWLNKGNGDFGEYSKMGARDAVNYYNSVDGNMEKLMLSYDWEWLYEFYMKYHG